MDIKPGQRWHWIFTWNESKSDSIIEILTITNKSIKTQVVQVITSTYTDDVIGYVLTMYEQDFKNAHTYSKYEYLTGQDR
jgi:hypothetical protein